MKKLQPVIIALIAAFTLFGCSNSANLTDDVSGVWQGDADNTMVEFAFMGETPTIKIFGVKSPVALTDIDNDNGIISFEIEKGLTWAVQRVTDEDDADGYYLHLTTPYGGNDDLSFIRNL